VDNSIVPVRGCFTDFLGRITNCRFLPSIAHLENQASTDIPVPGDGFYADTIEYIGLLMAYKTLESNHFVMAEFGAGWGPWVAAAGVIGRRRGIANMDLVAVEASTGKIELVKQHLLDNRLRPDGPDFDTRLDGVHCRCIRGAVWSSDGKVDFPSVVAEQEYGGAVMQNDGNVDYRGFRFEYEPVPAYTVESILGDCGVVDFIHIDIQGAELEVLRQSLEFLRGRSRYIFVGTHSRTIEGELVTLLCTNGFELLREKPCRFSFGAWPGALEGLTTADGGQLWRNSRIGR
jgi:FkbM family methyltransferase